MFPYISFHSRDFRREVGGRCRAGVLLKTDKEIGLNARKRARKGRGAETRRIRTKKRKK